MYFSQMSSNDQAWLSAGLADQSTHAHNYALFTGQVLGQTSRLTHTKRIFKFVFPALESLARAGLCSVQDQTGTYHSRR